MNVLGFCAGVAGIELGLRVAEPATRPVCFVEADPFAQGILRERYGVPIWSNIHTFDPVPWAGVAELLAGGIPCQPWSDAGLHKGVLDSRWLWPSFARSVRVIRPRFVFIENVPGILKRGGAKLILSDLAGMGFNIATGVF